MYLYIHTFSQRAVHVPDGYLRAYIVLCPEIQRQCARLIRRESRVNRHQVSHWPVVCVNDDLIKKRFSNSCIRLFCKELKSPDLTKLIFDNSIASIVFGSRRFCDWIL